MTHFVLTWAAVAIIFAIGVIFGIILVCAFVRKLGTFQVDLKASDEEDIARFIFDKTLEEAVGRQLWFVSVEKKEGLKSIK